MPRSHIYEFSVLSGMGNSDWLEVSDANSAPNFLSDLSSRQIRPRSRQADEFQADTSDLRPDISDSDNDTSDYRYDRSEL